MGRRLVGSVVGLVFLLVLVMVAVSAASARADSPWWHLSAGARPSYLRAGIGKPGKVGSDEKQKVAVSGLPGEQWSLGNMTKQEVENIETECPAGELKFAVFEVGAQASVVQAGLEGVCGYGPGSVEVTGTPSAEPTEYEVTFKGPLAERPVRLMNTEIVTVFFGSAVAVGVTELSPGVPSAPPTADGEIYVTAENLGDANVSGVTEKVRFKDVLPKGLKVVGVAGSKPSKGLGYAIREAIPCAVEEVGEVTSVTCTSNGELAPYDQLEMRVGVDVEVSAPDVLQNRASISGGGAQPVSVTRPVTVSEAPVPYGIERYEMALEEEGGAPSVQAGVHPFQMTTTVDFNQLRDLTPLGLHEVASPSETGAIVSTPALTKDVNVKLPPGLIGNPTPIPQCSTTQFFQVNVNGDAEDNACPPDSAVGVAVITINEPVTIRTATNALPIFNLEPRPGEPARFGFYFVVGNTPVFIDTAVRTGSDYGVTAEVSNITQLTSVIASDVTFWGVPGDSRHDKQRGWGCLDEARNLNPHQPCTPAGQEHPAPFLDLPTSCRAPLMSSVEADSWDRPGAFQSVTEALRPESALSGCNRLQFSPEIKVAPDGQEASKPTGLTVDVHVPQEVNENAAGYASSNVKKIKVAFPKGVVLNPAAADGLQACSEEQVGLLPGRGEQEEMLFTPTLPQAFCPDASKIGTVDIASPLLPAGQHVKGSLYLATPSPNGEDGKNPFGSLVAMYIVASDPISGTLVKLPGTVALDPNTGQITATFDNNPQLAFEDAEIHLFGGERAPLATPSHCGLYTTNATFTPWSGTPPVASSSSFEVKSGPNGTPCPGGSLPFSPVLQGGSTNINAGSFSPLTTTISREDGSQDIQSVRLRFPPGLSGILTGVKLCDEADANTGTCGQESLIGHTIVSVGLGGDPFSVTGGQVFLTEGYRGAPFGLSIVNPAKAGPFDLGKVIVRAKVEVDPHTAALTVTTDESGSHAIPHILDGIPLQIKHVNVTIDRPGFTFNPTNCNPTAITGTIGSDEGGSAPVGVPFQVTNCAAMKFAPKFSVSTSGKNSKAGGASLTVKLSEPSEPQGSQANIARVKVELPKQLPSRLTTLQKACTAAQFAANPAGCPVASIIGHAIVHTPLLPVPLEGPAYFVSNGGEAFPNLIMVLQGYGVRVDLVGDTFISKAGITSSTFKTIPDVPFRTFELTLPQGPNSALATNVPAKANYSLCGQRLVMPSEFVAQSGGAPLTQNTQVSVTGCAKTKALTRARKLALALKACHRKHNHAKRAACERAARKKYGPVKQKHKKKEVGRDSRHE
jgi:hypothetical protein